MKKFYNNTIMSGALSKALRVLALLCVLMGVSSSAWGDAGFHDSDAWNIKYYPGSGNSDVYITGGVNNGGTKDLGTLSGTPYLKEILAKTWKTKNAGNVCGVTVKYKIDNGSEKSLTLNNWTELGESDGSVNQQLSQGLDVALPSTSGSHTISFTFTASVNTSNTGSCNSTKTMNGTITYTIAGGGGGDDPDPSAKYYIIGGWDNWTSWNEMQLGSDGYYSYYAATSAQFKISGAASWPDNTWWKEDVKVSPECTTMSKDDNGGNVYLNVSNVYIKYNASTGFLWTEAVQCTQEPVYTVPSSFALTFGESIDLNNICSSTSDADITYTIKSGSTYATLSGSTLTAKEAAGTITIQASQALKTPYCSGSTEFTIEVVEKSNVLLAEDAVKNANESWTLSGYLEKTDCKEIAEYGFFLCGAESEGGCVPTSSSHDIVVNEEGDLLKGAHFTGIVNKNNIVSEWYGYRAYVKEKTSGKYLLSSETRYFTNCNTVYGDTIYVTIDNTLTANNKCDFRFKSFDDAWATLKTHKTICTVENVTYGTKNQDKITLVKPVVMQVVPNLQETYKGTEAVGLSGGDMKTAKAIFFRNINMNGGKELVVRSINKTGTRATLEHIAIRRSKNITLDYINITGTSTVVASADNALDIDNGEGDDGTSSGWNPNAEGLSRHWNCATQGAISNANIIIKNCFIQSYGFTCVHVSAYDGVTFVNNEIKALYDFVAAANISHSKGSLANNTALWGASAKFLNSQNITFVRNNFTGQHATSILLQGTQKVLIYNNVFWHENAVKSKSNTVAIIRLMSFDGDDEDCASKHPVQNIGIYYNTMFLKDNSVGADSYNYFDFFRIGGNEQTGFADNYYPGTIEFDYNNCYSYDYDVYGKNKSNNATTNYLQSMSEDTWCGSFKYNNFWSQYEEDLADKPTKSAFELGSGCGTSNTFTNVANLVCKTAAEEPGSLVVKGEGLNIGAYIKTDESGLLTSDMQMIDRLGNARPYDPSHTEGAGKYTVGAYQQSLGTKVSKIIWNGNVSTDWDNRNNWYKPNGQLVTCVDILTEDLEVVIPAPNTTKYPVPEGGVLQYPKLPNIVEDNDFSTERATTWFGEEVTAGKGQISKPTKVSNSITMEYGAALIGVEQLAQEGKTPRYTQASTELIVPRKKWILVGPIIRPFNDKGEADDMLSGHYYIDQQLPHVWMHEAEWTGSEVSWKSPFPDLNIVVPANKVFAIQIPDMYGTNLMFNAERYNKYFGTSYNGEAPIDYTFTGRFTNESALPTYTGLKSGVPALLNNSYPANINVQSMRAETGGTVQIYDYDDKSFRVAEDGDLIIAQHGFVYTPSKNGDLIIPIEAFETSNTEHRSLVETSPEVSIKVSNSGAQAASVVNLTIDWLKADAINYDTDAPKVFNAQETKLPDLYITRYNAKWAGLTVPTYDEPIPLGIRVSAENQTFVFSLNDAADMTSVVLEDRLEGKTYDLLAGETCTVSNLAIGDCEGRFFLNVGADQYIEDDDVTTDVEDVVTDNNIYIYSKNNNIVVSCSSDVQLQTVIVNDMSGRTATYNVSGQYAEFNLPVVQGVYLVKVIGDTATKTGKVILK